MHKKISLALSLVIIIGCGGGGSSNGNNASAVSVPPTPPPTPTQSFDELKTEFEGHYEYSNQWGLSTINASAAYARGATGKNITIGITDSGLDDSHSEIDDDQSTTSTITPKYGTTQ